MPIRRRYSRDPQNGEPVAIDPVSGFKVLLSSLVKQWDGEMVYAPFCDRRNPQDFVRGKPDRMALPYARPESPDVFLAQPLLDQAVNVLVDQAGHAILEQGLVVSL